MTIHQTINDLAQSLRRADVEAPALCARVLTAHILGCTKNQLVLRSYDSLTPEQQARLLKLAQRCAAGEPLAYIIGSREFYGRDFSVTPATLIPRPETEDVLEAAFAELDGKDSLFFADIGTGTGCIAITMACERPSWQGFMLDISAEALSVACHNATRLGVTDRIQAVRGDLCALPFSTKGALDLIISNPPYVSGPEYAALAPGVRCFEPRKALTPDEKETTGLPHIIWLARQCHNLLREGGLCIVEHGYLQGPDSVDIFREYAPWKTVRTGYDLAGKARFCCCKK